MGLEAGVGAVATAGAAAFVTGDFVAAGALAGTSGAALTGAALATGLLGICAATGRLVAFAGAFATVLPGAALAGAFAVTLAAVSAGALVAAAFAADFSAGLALGAGLAAGLAGVFAAGFAGFAGALAGFCAVAVFFLVLLLSDAEAIAIPWGLEKPNLYQEAPTPTTRAMQGRHRSRYPFRGSSHTPSSMTCTATAASASPWQGPQTQSPSSIWNSAL